MGDMMKEPREKEKPTAGQIVTGAILTVIALPFLLVATCIPAIGVNALTNGTWLGPAVWALSFIAIGIWRVIVTKNPGVRWAIIVFIVVAAIVGILALSTNLFDVHWYNGPQR